MFKVTWQYMQCHPNAIHADGTREYDVHNLSGHQLLKTTYNALLQAIPEVRPFIIGRSTFAGSDKWAGRWGDDNASLFAHIVFSIPQAVSVLCSWESRCLRSTLAASPTTRMKELCNWGMQLSASFPSYRNHNALSSNPQEAYVWSSVIDASKTAMDIRYQILPYISTLLYLSHSTGPTIMRALAWGFANDSSLAAADRQFFLGPSVLVTLVLNQGYRNVSGVFPGVGKGEVYYDEYTLSAVNSTPGENGTVDAPLAHIPVYIKGGNIITTQEPPLVTRDARKNPWGVIAAFCPKGTANGELYVVDGESLVQSSTTLFEVGS